MPTTFQGVVAIAIALLPGALYTWAFERMVGRWGIGLSDRLLRFVGASAIFQALVAPVTYWLWSTRWSAVVDREHVPWWLWAVPVAYVALPLVAGTVIGVSTRSGVRWAKLFTGPDPAPRAWDYLFQGTRDGWIRLRLKSGVWLGGGYANSTEGLKSYSAGYPEAQDLFLATTVRVDPDTGEFLFDDDGNPDYMRGGILVRWEEVEYLEFIDA
jgi:Family of unknown function (DUF6338)